MDEQTTDVMSDEEALEAEDEIDLGDAIKKKGEGFMGKTIDL